MRGHIHLLNVVRTSGKEVREYQQETMDNIYLMSAQQCLPFVELSNMCQQVNISWSGSLGSLHRQLDTLHQFISFYLHSHFSSIPSLCIWPTCMRFTTIAGLPRFTSILPNEQALEGSSRLLVFCRLPSGALAPSTSEREGRLTTLASVAR